MFAIDRAMPCLAQHLDQMRLHGLCGRPGLKRYLARSSFHYPKAKLVGKRRCLLFTLLFLLTYPAIAFQDYSQAYQ